MIPDYVHENHNRGTERFGFWGWFGADEADLKAEPGMVSTVFTQGHCHSFALALRQLVPGAKLIGISPTMWEIQEWVTSSYGYPMSDDPDEMYVTSPYHFLCQLPDGRYMDARGFQNAPGNPEPWEPPRTVQEWHCWGYKTPRVRDALPFARAALEEYVPEFLPKG